MELKARVCYQQSSASGQKLVFEVGSGWVHSPYPEPSTPHFGYHSVGVPMVDSCGLCLQTRVFVSVFAPNSEVHKVADRTRKKPLEWEKEYL